MPFYDVSPGSSFLLRTSRVAVLVGRYCYYICICFYCFRERIYKHKVVYYITSHLYFRCYCTLALET